MINLNARGVRVIKLPNGFGTVYKLSGQRRKPYIARRTIGWDENGKQLLVTVGTYVTRQEGLQALAVFNDNPYDLIMSKLTFAETYQKWFDDTFDDDANRSTVKNYRAAYTHCAMLYNMKMADIRRVHLQQVIDGCTSNGANRIKILLGKIYTWCIQREYIKKNYAENLTLPKIEQKTFRRAFTKEHIALLWKLANTNPNISLVLMLIYSGVRINELLELEKADVDLTQQWFRVRASKTNAGIRIVPIANKVLPLWKQYMERSRCKYAVCTPDGAQLTYDNYRKNYWRPLMEQLNMDYIPHECRHTCNSLLIMANTNPTIRKKIIGHKSQMDLGEDVYGHIYIEELLKAINQI